LNPQKWYADPVLVGALPMRYRAYAMYSRLFGSENSRKIRGGSFLLRALAGLSRMVGLPTVVPIHGAGGLVALVDMGDRRVLDAVREIRGEHPEFPVMKSLLSEGDTFIDIGANSGTYALLASRMVGQTGKVIAIEPQPELARSIAASALLSNASNIEVMETACGKSSGSSKLMIPVNDTGRAGLHPGFSGQFVHSTVTVSLSSLDSLLENAVCPGKMLIKIDVEGNEMDILSGARETIARYRPAVIVELNQWSATAAGTSVAEIVERLQSLGYSSFFDTSLYPEQIQPSEIQLDEQSNLLAIQ
jgi:methyltransferase, FkbM family